MKPTEFTSGGEGSLRKTPGEEIKTDSDDVHLIQNQDVLEELAHDGSHKVRQRLILLREQA